MGGTGLRLQRACVSWYSGPTGTPGSKAVWVSSVKLGWEGSPLGNSSLLKIVYKG